MGHTDRFSLETNGLDDPSAFELTDWNAIPTPWQPQPIIWKYGGNYPYYQNRRDFQAYTCSSYDYLVREVSVLGSDALNFAPDTTESLEERLALVALGQKEFAALSSTGIRMPDSEWFSFHDGACGIRTLARVAIIDGIGLDTDKITPSDATLIAQERRTIALRRRIYRDMTTSVHKLIDIENDEQYVYGIPRNERATLSQTYLVDSDIHLNKERFTNIK